MLLYHSFTSNLSFNLRFISRNCVWCSVSELGDLSADAVEAAAEGHIHEFGLGVHLESTKDSVVDFVVNGELLARVLGVGLKGGNDLRLLVVAELRGGDDGDLLLLVELLVELGVLLSDHVKSVEALVLGEDGEELEGSFGEWSGLLEGLVELADLVGADTTVLGEEAEHL